MRHLVTGGAGFIGSALCDKLSAQNNEVISFDNFSRKSHINTHKPYHMYNGDIRDIYELNKCIKRYGQIDYLWHLAYINGTKTFYSNPELVLEVGVKGAINTIDSAIKYKIPNYILASTSEVYNEPLQVPTTELEKILIPDVYNPRFSYSGGKIISELLSIHYAAKNGINVKIFRPHNVYGPNMGVEHVIPEIIKKIIKPENPQYINDKLIVNIQGTGLETRSFCFIEDAVDQISLISTLNSETYNVGVENEITINELVNSIAEILNVKIEIVIGNKTNGSSNRRCPDMSKFKSLGYIPKHTLYQGLEKTIKWYREYYE